MEKETIFIAVGNQKGGVGKSTLTTLIASYLHYNTQKKVAVIDCDFPQHSVFRMRNSDIETIGQNPQLQAALQKQFAATGKKAYRIIESTPARALGYARELAAEGDTRPDLVLFDLPGSVDNAGILNVIFNLDYIFVPIIADKRVLQSSLAFIMSVERYRQVSPEALRLRSIFLFWNKVDKRESTELYAFFDRIVRAENYKILETQLPDTKKYNKEISPGRSPVFRSTLFPPDRKLLKNSNIEALVHEMSNIINL
ncbi:ParA family protein [Dysgonomonas sp. GY75]|uniref:ParA family protein n=1 Tax=Dysgonomonas sp. GY75 TaxID=2780419 RepID=UPI0018845ED0|nr:ParA family protein [Dysgonomonas sp. GY75]MBF0647410.1 ParA family protein [Dysgonomonas sp. GY75]